MTSTLSHALRATHPAAYDELDQADTVAAVMRVAIADVYADTEVTAGDRLTLMAAWPMPAGFRHGWELWWANHIDVRVQAVADVLRDWWNRDQGIEDHDGRVPTELLARQSWLDGEMLAAHLVDGCSAAVQR